MVTEIAPRERRNSSTTKIQSGALESDAVLGSGKDQGIVLQGQYDQAMILFDSPVVQVFL
jgi:hypothetical protein